MKNQEIEHNLISFLVDNPEKVAEAKTYLQPEAFAVNQLSRIYTTILFLHDNKKEIDLFTIQSNDENIQEEVLFSLSDYVKTNASNFKAHLEILREDFIKNRLDQTLKVTMQNIYTEDAMKQVMDLRESLDNLIELGVDVFTEPLEAVVDRVNKHVKEVREGKSTKMYRFGIRKLDEIYSFQPGQLIIIGARPGMGKTSFAISVFDYMSLGDMNPVLFSLEMTNEELVKRLVSKELRRPILDINLGRCTDQELQEAKQMVLRGDKVLIDNCYTMEDIEVRSRQEVYNGAKAIFIDYLQLMTIKRKSENKRIEIGEMTRRLKLMAKELDVPVILLSQLSRANENRPGKRPQMSDLRESGEIEQNADSVIFIHRPEYYGIMEDENGDSTTDKAEIIVSKNRHGQTGYVVTDFIKEITLFPTLADNHIEQKEEAPF